MGLVIGLGSALAELTPPDYRAALSAEVEAEADRLLNEGRAEEARDFVHAFRREVADDARLIYEEGLIRNLLGEPKEAEALYRTAVERDAGLAAAWYDLGGLLLLRGDDAGAEAALERASALTVEHKAGWAAPLQLALIAARRQDARGMEQHLREALRRGLRFTDIAGHPEWTAILRDPALGPVLTELITVYGEGRLLDTWR